MRNTSPDKSYCSTLRPAAEFYRYFFQIECQARAKANKWQTELYIAYQKKQQSEDNMRAKIAESEVKDEIIQSQEERIEQLQSSIHDLSIQGSI